MSISQIIDVVDPQVDLVHDHANDGQKCKLLRIRFGDGNNLTFHFNKMEDLQAFIGLQVLAIGGIPGVESNTATDERLRTSSH